MRLCYTRVYMYVVETKFISYNCVYVLNSIIQFISQVYSRRPVGGQVQGCAPALSITYIRFYTGVRD